MNFCKHPSHLVVEAGKLLLKRGLVVRTWGNVSARTDASHFCITPTGASYEKLKAEDIVNVCLKTLQLDGRRQPSSELLVHAKIYQHFPNVSFILHTHQKWASLLSLMSYGKMDYISVENKWKHLLGNILPSAEYAEAGTEEIAQNLLDAILAPFNECKCELLRKGISLKSQDIESGLALMAYHGVVAFAKDADNAFTLAQELENYAKSFVLNKLHPLNIQTADVSLAIDDILSLDDLIENTRNKSLHKTNNTDNNNEVVIEEKLVQLLSAFNDFLFENAVSDNPLAIQKETSFFFVSPKKSSILSYLVNLKDYKSIWNIERKRTECSCIKEIAAYFDDVAQIAGSFFRIFNIRELKDNWERHELFSTFQEASILIIEGEGMLITSPSKEEACNIIHLFEKNTYAFLLSLMDEKIKPLSINEARKLHKGYITSYSKRAQEQ